MEPNRTDLTKEEAIQAMREGKKVRHRYFSNDEWMTMQGNQIALEDGVKCLPCDFWRDRNNPEWERGYSIVSEEVLKTKEEIVSAEQYRKNALTGRLYDSTHFDVTDTIDIMLEEYACIRVEEEKKKIESLLDRQACKTTSQVLKSYSEQKEKPLLERIAELEEGIKRIRDIHSSKDGLRTGVLFQELNNLLNTKS